MDFFVFGGDELMGEPEGVVGGGLAIATEGPADFSSTTGLVNLVGLAMSVDLLLGVDSAIGLTVVVLMTIVVFGFSYYERKVAQVNKKLFKRSLFIRTCSIEVG